MIFPEIQQLYKYMPWNDNTKKSLLSSTFWFSRPENFNDPFDCGIKLLTNSETPAFFDFKESTVKAIHSMASSILKVDSSNLFKEQLQRYQNELQQLQPAILEKMQTRQQDYAISDQIKNKITKIGVLSLSETCESMLMWSHYASQHTGICIELNRLADNDLGNKLITLPVRYSIKKPAINSSDYRSGLERDKLEIERSLIYTKSNDWSYEREWRMVKEDIGNSSQHVNSEIKSITIGARASDETRNVITLLSIQRGFSVKLAKLNDHNFGLDIKTSPSISTRNK